MATSSLISNNNQLLSNLGTGSSIFTKTPAGYKVPSVPTPLLKAPSVTAAGVDDNSAFMASLQAQLKALQQQVVQTPKLPAFDIMANYNKAKSQAEAAVNPLYTRKLNEYLARNAQLKAEKQNEVALSRSDVQIELDQSLQDNATTRIRTAEDVAAALDKIGRGETLFQSQEGVQNDVARRNEARSLAASGLAGSGIGSGQVAESTRLRNEASTAQVQDFNEQKAAKKVFQTRTFEDLAKGDTRSKQSAESKNKAIQLDLDSYMTKLAYDELATKYDLESKRLTDIIGQTDSYQSQGVDQFLASIAKSVRPQDLALATQVYRK